MVWLDESFSWGNLTNSAGIHKSCQSNEMWIYTENLYPEIMDLAVTLVLWIRPMGAYLSTNNWWALSTGWNSLSANFALSSYSQLTVQYPALEQLKICCSSVWAHPSPLKLLCTLNKILLERGWIVSLAAKSTVLKLMEVSMCRTKNSKFQSLWSEKADRCDLTASSMATLLRVCCAPKESHTLNNFQWEQLEDWDGARPLQLQHEWSRTKPRALVISCVPICTRF